MIVTAYPFPPMLGTDPLRLLIGSVVRKAPRSLGAHVKSLNYLDAIVAKQQAKAAGLDDAVMLDAPRRGRRVHVDEPVHGRRTACS